MSELSTLAKSLLERANEAALPKQDDAVRLLTQIRNREMHRRKRKKILLASGCAVVVFLAVLTFFQIRNSQPISSLEKTVVRELPASETRVEVLTKVAEKPQEIQKPKSKSVAGQARAIDVGTPVTVPEKIETPTCQMEEEIQLLESLRKKLISTQEALVALSEMEARCPEGVLVAERFSEKARLLCENGSVNDANQILERLERDFPANPVVRVVRKKCNSVTDFEGK